MTTEVLTEDTGIALEAMFGEKSGTGAISMGSARRKESREVAYWIRTDGWIGLGPTSRTDAPAYIRFIEVKHWKPLPLSYGVEVEGANPGTMRGPTQLRNFIKNGGLTARATVGDNTGKEPGEYLLPTEQLIVLGMHRDPKMVALRPDLEGAAANDLACEYGCLALDGSQKRRLFAKPEWRDAHVVAAHKEAIASEAVGKTISKAMGSMQGASIDPTTIAAIVTAVMQAMKAAPPVEQAAVASLAMSNASVPEADEDDWEADDDIPVPPPMDFGLPNTTTANTTTANTFSTGSVEVTTIVPATTAPIERPIERQEFTAVNSRGNFPNGDWTRNQMWSWLSTNRLPFPPNHTKLKTSDTLAYINISFPHMAA